uniref:Uncharacterized protein n=2 Tax=Oryza punctata TaxID=4537 RepID=A0A0E0JEC8_ORYPU
MPCLEICMNVYGWEGMLFIGLNAALSVRVSNELLPPPPPPLTPLPPDLQASSFGPPGMAGKQGDGGDGREEDGAKVGLPALDVSLAFPQATPASIFPPCGALRRRLVPRWPDGAVTRVLWAFIKLSLASAVMPCLEIWYLMVLVGLTGHLDDAEIAVDSISI